MYTEFNSFYKIVNRFSIIITVFITVNLTKIRADNCGQEELVRCAKPFQLLQSTNIADATKKEDLDKLCPDLYNGLACIRSYTRRCMTLQQRDHFNKLYNGTHQFVRDLCKEGQYQDEFLQHSPCLQKVRPEYEVCAKTYQITMSSIVNRTQRDETSQVTNHRTADRTAYSDPEDDVKLICCSFIEYLDCSEQTAKRTCGAATAKFTRGFLDKMSSSLIQMYCEDYYIGSESCPNSSSASLWGNFSSSILLAITPTIITLLTTYKTMTQFHLV